ncbi:16S rRNA (cytidine1402-2'-O)-methyltransferase [Blastomonas natatoria]|uniref:Ribosomal RNA small subunit methyltransferase I n=1 Tax=Blastomonas natatoria TaxID=34015 RepID=A0A2V3V096_9SPHN|nr:16S rRNA (cytidine(1402)-2'-O)-methyltransferase [Blastomonas natatoria]PXW75186.1 16S rRNA (cytidine1402-2'-O)-methyltransferase [Blastomonas natatoria]
MNIRVIHDPEPGLYIVATPIGNLGDLSERARRVLEQADLIACEDSRVTGGLLHHLGFKRPLVRYDDHARPADRERLIGAALQGPVALVSDAGTPLISDPGYKLVREARAAGVAIHSVPGPSAVIVALTLAGLPTDRFYFHGFLPNKAGARDKDIGALAAIPATLVFYESAKRLAACLEALHAGLGNREAAVVREISKKFEETRTGTLGELAASYADAAPKGEIVIVVGPPLDDAVQADEDAVEAALQEAMATMPPGKAAGEVARRFGLDRKALYARIMAERDG